MKQMWDKKVLVEVIHKESPKVEVDSELSETSENPVQNKVITEALGEVLPDTTGQTDKFLKVGSEGLEWAEAGGNKKYIHYIHGYKNGTVEIGCTLITDSSTPLSTPTLLGNYLYSKGLISNSNNAPASGLYIESNVIKGYVVGIFGDVLGTVGVITAFADGSSTSLMSVKNISSWNTFYDTVVEL